MADVVNQLVAGSYSARKVDRYSTEVVRTDGGGTFRNSRWASSLSQWDVTLKTVNRTHSIYTTAVALFDATLGSGLTFTFHDPVACADVEAVILEDSITITPTGNLVTVEFSVEEARPSGNSP